MCLYGMDTRTQKTMQMFLLGPCKEIARVVKESEAEIDIIDADAIGAKDLLDLCLARKPMRPVILLALEQLEIENTIYVKKPVKTEMMLSAFKEADKWLKGKKKKTGIKKPIRPVVTEKPAQKVEISKPAAKVQHVKIDKLSDEKKVYVNPIEQQKTEKHKAAMMINEQSFSSFLGIVPGVDFDDPLQWQNASYNPKQYYQGYVQSAVKTALNKGQTLQLNSGWKPLIIFPNSDEVWLDVDDKQLRAFAGVTISAVREAETSASASAMRLLPVNPDQEIFSTKLDKFHSINAFLWKLACWTSKGRYPSSIEALSAPLYLKQWPNFTRLVITPHAMRISALLISGPRSIEGIIHTLNIKPQYVFIFVSAAYATGILGHARRQADKIIETEIPAVKSVEKKGIISRIMKKLRGYI